MDPGDLIDAVEEITDLVKRPKRTIAKRTALAYVIVVTVGGTFCAQLYREPSIIAPRKSATIDTQMVATTSASSIAAMPSVVSSYTSTTYRRVTL